VRKNAGLNKDEDQGKEKGEKKRRLGAHHQLDRHEGNSNRGHKSGSQESEARRREAADFTLPLGLLLS
jgi:hypothetical protein